MNLILNFFQISRLIGTHELILLNYYSYIARFLTPHQREVIHLLQYSAQVIRSIRHFYMWRLLLKSRWHVFFVCFSKPTCPPWRPRAWRFHVSPTYNLSSLALKRVTSRGGIKTNFPYPCSPKSGKPFPSKIFATHQFQLVLYSGGMNIGHSKSRYMLPYVVLINLNVRSHLFSSYPKCSELRYTFAGLKLVLSGTWLLIQLRVKRDLETCSLLSTCCQITL